MSGFLQEETPQQRKIRWDAQVESRVRPFAEAKTLEEFFTAFKSFAVESYMCAVDYQFELRDCAKTPLYGSPKACKELRKCTAGDDRDHRVLKVFTLSIEDIEFLQKKSLEMQEKSLTATVVSSVE